MINQLRVAVLFALCLLTAVARADLSYTGTFTHDDDMFAVGFSLPVTSDIVIQTWSFAGGTNAAGQVIPPGGFAPVVSLFDSSGNLLVFDDGGVAPNGCGTRNIDPVTGFCLDASLDENMLPAGQYTVILTEWDNTPNGPTLADGFAEQGNGDFTGGPFLLDAGSEFQRTGNWALDVPGGPSMPEPSYLGLLVLLLAALVGAARCRCAVRRSKPSAVLLALGLLLPHIGRTTTLNVAADSYISGSYPTLNFGNAPVLNIGGTNAALLGLDLSSLPAGLTKDNIQQATLTVFVKTVSAPGGLYIAPITSDWGESSVNFSSPPGAGAVLNPSQPVPASEAGSYVTFDITSLVAGWVSGAARNNGVEITAADGAVVVLDSKEATTTSHAPFGDVIIVGMGPLGPTGPAGAPGVAGQPALGKKGEPGPNGPTGPAGLNWRGNWASSTAYAALDGVAYGGSSWVALQSIPGANAAPPAAGSLWGVVAAQGAAGPQGATGPVSPNYRGPWQLSTTYNANDVATFNGSPWIALPNTGSNGSPLPNKGFVPGSNAAWWASLAAAGPAGPAGAQGPSGPEGPSGNSVVAGSSCPVGTDGNGRPIYGVVTGFNSMGFPICTQLPPCTTQAFPVQVTSVSAILESWPTAPLSLQNNNGCAVTVLPPAHPDGSECPISGSLDNFGGVCAGWQIQGSSGWSACIVVPNYPACTASGALPSLESGFPTCSSAIPGSSHSTAGATVVCFR